MFYLWLIIVILLTVVEIMTKEFTTIWFVVSGIIALILSFVTDNFFTQLAVFAILGIVLLITVKSLLLNIIAKRNKKVDFEEEKLL